MFCPLASVGAAVCPGADQGLNCTVYGVDAVFARFKTLGSCSFKNLRAPAVGIYAPKRGIRINPIKASKKG